MAPASPSAFWNIPYQRNRFFTGREDILNQMYRALRAEHTVALSQPQGITGLGGIGKTQSVLEYAYRHRDEYDAVFWVRADSTPSLTSSMIEIAQILHLPERSEKDQEVIVQAALRWFRVHTGWLLIYDNIDDFSLAKGFLPKAGPGHLLFTTRSHSLGGLAQRLDIQQMDPEIGALLLLRRASLLALQAALNAADPDEQRLAQSISQELDGLPLALDQAGAYVKEAPCLLPDYLARYQIRRSDILRIRGSSDQYYPASVATTWSLSFEKVSQANPAAAELLNFCAFLAPDAIPEAIITKGAPHLGDVLAPVVANPIQLDLLCKEVLKYSLFQRGFDTQTLTVHRLVQAVLQDNLLPETRVNWKQRAVLAVSTASPNVGIVEQWDACEQWIPHALACATWIEQEQINRRESAFLLNQAGYYLNDRGRYHQAEPLYGRALAVNEQILGGDHPDTAVSLDNLAGLYRGQGKYTEAEPLSKRALAINERQLREHSDTARSLNNLAELYKAQGKYAEAEPLYRRALSICEKQLGKDHLYTAVVLNNQAELYHTQGKYTEAERLYRQALSIREKQLGKDHLNTTSSLNNLAELYKAQGKYAEAEPLCRRVLSIHEKQLGEDNPKTATSLNNLANLCSIQGKYVEAERLYQRALVLSETLLGEKHSDTAGSLNNLAELYKVQGRYAEAEPLYRRALAICEQRLGEGHPFTAISLNNLAGIYQAQGKYAEAEPLYRRALRIHEREMGENHPDTATILNDLATLYKAQGRYAEAEPLYRRAMNIYEKGLGADHPDTAVSLNNLAGIYWEQEKYAEAEPLYRRALRIHERELGKDHPNVATSLNNLATLYKAQGRYAEAEPLYRQALFLREQQLGRNHPRTLNTLDNLAVLYYMMGKPSEADQLFRRGTHDE